MTAPINSGTKISARLLVVCTVDVMAWKLLLPWLRGLREAGCEVHIACSESEYTEKLRADGFAVHTVRLRRRINPLLHVAPLWQLYRLLRRERFLVVNTHSPVAAVVGRLAGWLARTPVVVYTVHGFYFHDDLPWWKRRAFIALEWLLGRVTDSFMFVSNEDRETALREGIARNPDLTITIYNGVNLAAYPARSRVAAQKLRLQLKIPETAAVIGIVGRMVREKGYLEFAEMARLVGGGRSDVYFLVVGGVLASDRDAVLARFQRQVQAAGLNARFQFTGFTERVADHLQIMDIFVLPSYREGFPRSVLEAMSTALPVVATNIRGCREAVVDGETGLLVPPRNGAALAGAVTRLLDNPDLAIRMGAAGRKRAEQYYGEPIVTHLFVDFIGKAIKTNPRHPARTI